MLTKLALLVSTASALSLTRRDLWNRVIAFAPVAPAIASENDEVEVLTNGVSTVFLIGTAHVSKESAAVVTDTINRARPSVIAVELDRKRIIPSKRDNRLPSLSGLVIRFLFGIVYKFLEQPGVDSGAEFAAALHCARKLGVPILLADRDVDLTLQRIAQAAKATDFAQLSQMDPLVDVDNTNMLSAIESIKSRPKVRKLLSVLEVAAPELYRALIAERDDIMAGNILHLLDTSKPDRLVLVCGMAHEDGIAARLRDRGFIDRSILDLPAKRQANTIAVDASFFNELRASSSAGRVEEASEQQQLFLIPR